MIQLRRSEAGAIPWSENKEDKGKPDEEEEK